MPDQPVLGQVNVVSSDMRATIEFFRLLGVSMGEMPNGWDRHHRAAAFGQEPSAAIDVDSTAYAGWWGAGMRPGIVLTLGVSDRDTVDEIYTRVTEAGYRGVREPYDAFWGARFGLVEGPDGLRVGLMSEVSDDRRMRPPSLTEFDPDL